MLCLMVQREGDELHMTCRVVWVGFFALLLACMIGHLSNDNLSGVFVNSMRARVLQVQDIVRSGEPCLGVLISRATPLLHRLFFSSSVAGDLPVRAGQVSHVRRRRDGGAGPGVQGGLHARHRAHRARRGGAQG